MTNIGFIGLGNMGGPMAANLLKAGHNVRGFDLSEPAVRQFSDNGGTPVVNMQDVVRDADVIITMLPAGQHVKTVYLGENGILAAASKGTLFIDSSTIDVETAREVATAAESAGMAMVDAPVSGGVGGAQAGTLTFMVGGPDDDFTKAEPILQDMGKTIVHAGGPGNGQAAKICNNMILGISMIGVSEAFVLAEKLGLDHQKLFDIASTASGQCWSLTTYCPVPGPVPTSPANKNYEAGFTVAMMLKDLNLAQAAAKAAQAATPLGEKAAAIYSKFDANGQGSLDFSGIIRHLREG